MMQGTPVKETTDALDTSRGASGAVGTQHREFRRTFCRWYPGISPNTTLEMLCKIR